MIQEVLSLNPVNGWLVDDLLQKCQLESPKINKKMPRTV